MYFKSITCNICCLHPNSNYYTNNNRNFDKNKGKKKTHRTRLSPARVRFFLIGWIIVIYILHLFNLLFSEKQKYVFVLTPARPCVVHFYQ